MRLCKVCLKSDFLCQACEKIVKKEGLSSEAIELERFLYFLTQQTRIREPSFDKVIDIGDTIIITTEKPALLIGNNGNIVKLIEKHFNKKVVVAHKNDYLSIAKKLLNIPIIGVNVVYKGKEILKIRIKKMYETKTRSKQNVLVSTFHKLFNKEIKLHFE